MNNILKTDLYQLTMMAAHYYKNTNNKIITCEAFARRMPPERKFFIMSGTEEIKDFLLNISFSMDDIKQLKEINTLKYVFSSTNFEDYLKDFKFTGDFWSMSEGEIVFPGEPLLRITAPISQANMVETFILSVLNYNINISSKAARIIIASNGKNVFEFGTRRTHQDSAISAVRSAYIAGFSATSNIAASFKYNIPLTGTMSHMWVMSHNNEEEAFNNFNDVYKDPVLLIDTYDTINGAKLAAKIKYISGVRLDSGNLKYLANKVRNILDENNCIAKIIVSGDLDEYKISELNCNAIDIFAVGTELVSPKDVSSLGIVYKAVFDHERNVPIVKKSINKQSIPGVKKVYLDKDNLSHIISLDSKPLTSLLDCYIKDGKYVNEKNTSLMIAREYCKAGIANLNSKFLSLDVEEIDIPIRIDESLEKLFNS